MNRRTFLGQAALAGAAASLFTPSAARAQAGGLTIHFTGMMGFIRRSDGSLLAVTPGLHPMGHFPHVPFLMARAGTPVAKALGMQPNQAVVPGSFHSALADARLNDFVYLCLENTALEIESADRTSAVDNKADELAQMQLIAPGRRLRGNLARWALSTASLRGGRLVNEFAHPDAGKVWSFGDYKQRLTDAAGYSTAAATLRLDLGSDVRTFDARNEGAELWFVSAAGPGNYDTNPKRLEHGVMLAEFLADASGIPIPTCEDAVGSNVPPTDLPCSPTEVASLAGGAARVVPPIVTLCYSAYFDGGSVK
ncbi:MAG: twin-arginine translocation signal domain-containing protein [Vicinamibacterales bacterium]